MEYINANIELFELTKQTSKGTVRGYTLRIDSDDSLERRRADLNKRNSKF